MLIANIMFAVEVLTYFDFRDRSLFIARGGSGGNEGGGGFENFFTRQGGASNNFSLIEGGL